MKLKLKIFMTILMRIIKIFDFSNYSSKSKYCDPNTLVVGKMKDEMSSTEIKEFAR